MQLYFIRHGQSENNALWGQTQDTKSFLIDPRLTSIGRRQTELLADHLVHTQPESRDGAWDPQNTTRFGITHIYTSLMLRAVETGTILARRLDLPLTAWVDLHERGGLVLDELPDQDPVGYPGQNRDFFEANFPQLVLPDGLGDTGWWGRPWENEVQRKERAVRVVKELQARHANSKDRVVLISHGGFYIHFLAALFGFPDEGGWWFLLNNTAISRIDSFSQEIQLVYHNRVAHLSDDLIT
jgi:2,3-bisphosphoglycerate-dependent phosphoglycerate mutase